MFKPKAVLPARNRKLSTRELPVCVHAYSFTSHTGFNLHGSLTPRHKFRYTFSSWWPVILLLTASVTHICYCTGSHVNSYQRNKVLKYYTFISQAIRKIVHMLKHRVQANIS